jgi:hypothetical protein
VLKEKEAERKREQQKEEDRLMSEIIKETQRYFIV